METIETTRHTLVISHDPSLAETVRKAAAGLTEVTSAQNQGEAFERIGELRPDIIVIGNLTTRATLLEMLAALREGWISHHSSLLLVETDASQNTCRVLTEKDLRIGIADYELTGASADLQLPAEQLIARLREAIAGRMKERENHLRNALSLQGNFSTIWEQIPGPGAFEMRQQLALENSRKAARSGMVAAISITDNPGGNPAIATDILCAEIRKAGIEPLVHIAFRDRNRNQAESLLFQLAALHINNVLILTGDYPSNLGFTGKSKPVFDLDSINGLRLVAEMNRGMEREILRRKVRLAPTDFFAGVAFSPFKQMEAEVMGQYYKLEKKIAAGADFIITQVGFDARKMHELLVWLKSTGQTIPALASVYVLSYPVARTMRENNIPGCVVTDALLHRIAAESESSDKGKQARLERAAKMFAIAKGMGYQGAYVSGQGLPFESLEYIVSRGNELAGNWMDLLPEFDYPQNNGFYYFLRDSKTGLNSQEPAPRRQEPANPPLFAFSRVVHKVFFEPASPLFRPMRSLMRRVDSSPFLYRLLHAFERWCKGALYGCKDCGDCALFDTAYLCPMSECPKDQRNAPCGGSFEGWCEVYPGKKQCIWVKAYTRLKTEHKEDTIGQHITPPCNWELWQTSSWVNFFLGRDHSSKRRGINPPEKSD